MFPSVQILHLMGIKTYPKYHFYSWEWLEKVRLQVLVRTLVLL